MVRAVGRERAGSPRGGSAVLIRFSGGALRLSGAGSQRVRDQAVPLRASDGSGSRRVGLIGVGMHSGMETDLLGWPGDRERGLLYRLTAGRRDETADAAAHGRADPEPGDTPRFHRKESQVPVVAVLAVVNHHHLLARNRSCGGIPGQTSVLCPLNGVYERLQVFGDTSFGIDEDGRST